MPMTAGDHLTKLLGRLPGSQENEVKSVLSEALRWLWGHEKWLFLLTDAAITTDAPYTTGTLTVAGTSLTLVGGTWDAAWKHRRVVIQGRAEIYNATILSASTATISPAWAGANASSLTYVMFCDLYALPSNCDWGRDSFWWRADIQNEVFILGTYEMKRRKARYGTSPGDPQTISRSTLEQTTETAVPVPLVELGPIPDGVYVINGWYFKKPAMPTQDAGYPLWPEDFEDLIWRRAEIEWAANPRHRLMLDVDHVRQFWTRLFECEKRNNGGAEITRIVELYMGRPMTRSLANFSDNAPESPYVLGL